MPGLNGRGPAGAGAITGRKMGLCNTSQVKKDDDELKKAIAGLVAIVIIGVSEMIWNWMKEKRLKSASK